jgi:hypothetical protein
METLAPSFSVVPDMARNEIFFTAAGLWDDKVLADFSRELLSKGKPFFSEGIKMRVLGDLTGFVAQTREIAAGIRLIVTESARLGVIRTAIVTDSQLTKMQYKRVNDGINLEIFATKAQAIAWLRSD